MLKYRCQLCGRIHYGKEGLEAGYCTTCGPKGGLIRDVNWKENDGGILLEGKQLKYIRKKIKKMGGLTENIIVEPMTQDEKGKQLRIISGFMKD